MIDVSAPQTEITSALLDKYFSLTQSALSIVTILVGKQDPRYVVAQDFLLMARSYAADAKHFREKNDFVRAYGAINYAHAWIDAGARMKLFSTGNDDSTLFASD